MKQFATALMPLRASSLPTFLECPLSVVLKMQAAKDDGNEWAQTGTLIHFGAEAFHKTGSDAVALAAMAHKKTSLPLADHGKAEEAFRLYVKREAAWGKVEYIEQKVRFQIQAAPSDPTQEAIVIEGSCDHVRHKWDRYTVCDIKTGTKYTGKQLLANHRAQLMAYQYGISVLLGNVPVGAAVIATRDFKYGGPVYHEADWTMQDVYDLMPRIAELVAQVRRGERVLKAGDACRYCPATRADCDHGQQQYTRYLPLPITTVQDAFQ